MSVASPSPIVDVFISYKREDRERITPILDGLRHVGLRVWWDRDIPGGASWRQTLIQHLDTARCVIVVWSESSASTAGEFVQEEAGRAKSRHVMLPLRIDNVTEPLGYGDLQSLDLISWAGNIDDPRFQDLVDAVKSMIAGGPRPVPAALRTRTRVTTGWFERSVAFTRGYFADLLDLTSGPKRFLAQRRVDHGATLDQGLRFLAVSFLLTFILQLSQTRGNPLVEFATDASFVSVYVLLFGCAVYLAWRLVGATAPIYQFFVIHFYLSGVLKLIQTAASVMARGILRSDRVLYEEVMSSVSSGDMLWFGTNAPRLLEHRVIQLFAAAVLGGFGAMMIWVLVGWGAYRELTGLTKRRSLLAFLLFFMIGVPVYIVTLLIAAALV